MAPRQHPQPAVAQFDDGVLVEAAIFEDNAAAELPVVSLIKGDKDIGPAHRVELAITLAERLRDMPAFPQRHGQYPLAIGPDDGFVQRSTETDITRRRPARCRTVGVVAAHGPVAAAAVEHPERLLKKQPESP